jgi:hypothetical protein
MSAQRGVTRRAASPALCLEWWDRITPDARHRPLPVMPAAHSKRTGAARRATAGSVECHFRVPLRPARPGFNFAGGNAQLDLDQMLIDWAH